MSSPSAPQRPYPECLGRSPYLWPLILPCLPVPEWVSSGSRLVRRLSPLVHNTEFQACESSRNVCCACSSQCLARDPLSPLLWTEGKSCLPLVPSEQEGLASQEDSPFLIAGSTTSTSQVGKLKRGGYGRTGTLGLPSSESRPLHAAGKTASWCSFKGFRISILSPSSYFQS